ncbi:M23 family metallopeptidase [Candidatus Berkelbacteria bacterium]|nr:M23 family metallopeptidase [Candidatus Berkelbacteria bacterium]
MKILLILVAVSILAVIVFLLTRPRPAKEASSQPTTVEQQSVKPSGETPGELKTIKAQDISGVASAFSFSAEIPSSWQAQAVAATEAINLYDPSASGANELEKSQIFIRNFKADSFLTLSTVTIHSREDTTVNGRPAVRYGIEKKSTVAQFANQPSWRSERHIVTDVRVSDSNPSIFYVIAKRPDFDEALYRRFLESFKVSSNKTSFVEPIDEFRSRITKKPFGIFITPATSPVQPERFSGYHAGVDVEYGDKPNEDIPVRSIGPGKVVHSGRATGYGGVLVILHTESNKLSLYGHLDPSSLAKLGSEVSANEQIGVLGEGGSAETDGERKHLHFAIIKGQAVNLKGYVQNQEDLNAWEDPLLLI